MATDEATAGEVIVWFEGTQPGRVALRDAENLAKATDSRLTVVAVATHERVIGCGRCLQGTVLWNIEMKKMAHEDLCEARRILEPATNASYELVVGKPADSISAVATSRNAQTIVLPWQRNRRLDPPQRRNVVAKIAANGPWKVVVGPRSTRPFRPLRDSDVETAGRTAAA